MCDGVFSWLLPPSIHFMRFSCNQALGLSEMHMVKQVLSLMTSLLKQFNSMESKQRKTLSKKAQFVIESMVIFSIIWGVGATTNGKGLARFDVFFR